jgi:hypothetical protein
MAPKIKVTLELDRTQILAVGVERAAPLVFATTRAVLNRSQVLTPVDTGNLRAGQRMTMRARRTFVAGRVEAPAKYAHFVHDGTKPHIIRARRKKALAFFWLKVGMPVIVPKKPGGGTGKRKGKKGVYLHIGKGFVRHPGTKARPFLMRALREEATVRGFIVTPMGVSAATGQY